MKLTSYEKCVNDAYEKLISKITEGDDNAPAALAGNTIKHIVGNACFHALRYEGIIRYCGGMGEYAIYEIVGMGEAMQRGNRPPINMQELLEKFRKEYAFLYEHKNNVAGYDEALKFGDKFITENPEFVANFVNYRQDFMSSDREVVALMFALESLGAI